MRKKRLSTLLLSGILLVAAAVASTALLMAGRGVPSGGALRFVGPAGTRQVTPTSTVLSTSSASPLPQGAPLMMTAAVTPAAAPGTVQFKDGSANIGDPVNVNNGKATQSTSTLSVGNHQLSAVFTPSDPARFGPSTAQAVPFTISGATPTNIVVSTSQASPLAQGSAVTLTAALTPTAAAGTVQFKDGSTNIGDPATVTNGTASTSTSTLTAGTHQLTAVFTPRDPKLYGPATSPAVPFTISGAAPTNTTMSASSTATPAVVGSTVTLTATVDPTAAAGTVQFRDGGTNIGDAVAVSNGNASQTTTTLAVGSHQLTAVFTPTDTNLYGTSTSPAVTFAIAGATASNTMMSMSPADRVQEGTPATMTATVAPSAAAGTVQFRDGTTNVGTPVAVNNGTATRSATFGVGSHQLTAVFTPTNTALYSSSNTASMTYTVYPQPILGAGAALAPNKQDPPGDRGPRIRRDPLSGLTRNVGAVLPLLGGSALLITRRRRKARNS